MKKRGSIFCEVRKPAAKAAILACALALLWSVEVQASPFQSTATVSSLPDTTAAATYVSRIADAALPEPEKPTRGQRLALGLIEAGFAVGTTTAVHELGHARRVKADGGRSNWETGDVNWWFYLSHRDPLGAGATSWTIPYRISPDQRIAITAGGFNATTLWDEEAAGHGPLGLRSARFSTLFYELASVGSEDDDLSQLEKLYRDKGYNITRRAMQGWQLLAGAFTQLGLPVRTYAYYTPRGVSLRVRADAGAWLLGAEGVVQGSSTFEGEVGRMLRIRNGVMVKPTILFCARGLGGSLKAELCVGRGLLSLSLQQTCPGSLQASRTTTNYNLQYSLSM